MHPTGYPRNGGLRRDRSASLRRARFRPAPDVRSRRVIHPDARLSLDPYEFAAARALAAELGVSGVLAQVLVRRGLGEPDAARAFLAAADEHPLDAFGGLREAASRILGHVARRSRITVHGDYDVDGICASAVLIRALRTLGADVDWYLPSRIDDGYGLAAATVDRLAARGTDLLVTVDCAITAVEEVARAERGGDGRRRHRPPQPARRRRAARTRRSSIRASAATRARTCAPPRSRTSSRRRCSRRGGGPVAGRRGPRPRRARHGRRRRPAGRARTAGSSAPACGRWPPRASRGCAR